MGPAETSHPVSSRVGVESTYSTQQCLIIEVDSPACPLHHSPQLPATSSIHLSHQHVLHLHPTISTRAHLHPLRRLRHHGVVKPATDGGQQESSAEQPQGSPKKAEGPRLQQTAEQADPEPASRLSAKEDHRDAKEDVEGRTVEVRSVFQTGPPLDRGRALRAPSASQRLRQRPLLRRQDSPRDQPHHKDRGWIRDVPVHR